MTESGLSTIATLPGPSPNSHISLYSLRRNFFWTRPLPTRSPSRSTVSGPVKGQVQAPLTRGLRVCMGVTGGEVVPGPGRETSLWAFPGDSSSRRAPNGWRAVPSAAPPGVGLAGGRVTALNGPSPPQNRGQLSPAATDRTVPPLTASSQLSEETHEPRPNTLLSVPWVSPPAPTLPRSTGKTRGG